MNSKSLLSLSIGLILLLSALAIVPITPAAAGTEGTITVSSDQFYGANVNAGGNGDPDAAADPGEALLQITINDPDISGSSATMPIVKAVVGGVETTLTLYQTVGGSWVCFVSDNSSGLIPINPPPQDTTVSGLEPDIDGDNDGIADALEDHDNDGIINAWEDTDTDGVVALYDAAGEAAALGNTYNYSKIINRLALNPGDTITIKYEDTDPPTVVETTVTYDSTSATVSIDRSEYPLNSKVIVTVEDPDLNFDPTTTEVRVAAGTADGGAGSVEWSATSDTTDNETLSSDFKETGPTTGVFKVKFDMSGAAFTEALLDIITITYDPPGENKSVTASVKAYTGEISLDASEYKISDTATVTLVEPDLNLDSTSKDVITAASGTVKVTSSVDDTVGTGIKMTETGENTGVFEGTFKFVFGATVAGDTPKINVSSGPQDITVKYADACSSTGSAVTVSATASFVTHTGTIELDRSSYGPNMVAKVTVTDPDLNTNPSAQDRIDRSTNRVTVQSTVDGPRGITILETGVDTGVFEGQFKFSTTAGANADIPTIQVSAGGDTITVTYNDALDETGAAKTITAKATYRTSTGSVSFAKSSYATSQKVKIVVTDPDLNLNTNAKAYLDIRYNAGTTNWELYVSTTAGACTTAIKTNYTSPPVFIYSSSWTTGWPTTPAATAVVFSMTETGANTGEFYYVTASDLNTLSGGAVNIGDTLYVQYIDAYNSVGSTQTLTGSAIVSANTGTLELDKDVAKVGEKVTITLTDPDLNVDPTVKDNVPAANITVKSSQDTDNPGGAGVFVETDKDTGVFKVQITLDKTDAGDSATVIKVKKGETVTVKYTDPLAAGGVTNLAISKTFTVYSSNGSVEFDKDTYSPVGKVKITVTDPDVNEDSLTVEQITAASNRIRVYSTTDPTGIYVGVTETDVDTGVFTATITLTDTGASNQAAGILRVSNGDSIVVTYKEEADASGTENVVRMDSAQVWYTDATLAFDKDTYTMDDTAIITLTEPDKNQNTSIKETVNITVYSTSDPAGITVTLVETDVDTGVFEGSLTFTSGSSTGSILKAADGDTITAVYTDDTPRDKPTITSKKVTATAKIGAAVPTLPIEAGAPALTDPTTGETLETGKVGKSVMVSTELSNTASVDQDMLYIVQIKDATGRVVYMSYISGTVPANRTFTFGIQWTPDSAGDYTVEVFAWKSWTEPTPLSESVSQTVTVTE
ncbi:MAG: hypothetical protein DRN61_00850 [Thaumarchaeota archaeon]|nr:MAG: hypothetical protein DRN61_00850 [Nitrososphaerota archaeon]